VVLRPQPERHRPPDRRRAATLADWGEQSSRPGTRLLPRGSAERLTYVLHAHPQWSVFWDKQYRVWRAAEDDPDSALYAEDPDPDTIISYITSHT
jgi:hypothetical protein